MPAYETVWPVLLHIGVDGSISAESSSLDRDSLEQHRYSAYRQ
jgi:hypothetical protein